MCLLDCIISINSFSFPISLRSDLPSVDCCQLKDVSPPHVQFYFKKIKAYWLRKIITVTFFFSQGLSGNGGKSGPLSSPRLIACSMTIEIERGENLSLYWSHIGLYFIKHPLALLLASPNLHPWFELLCVSVLVCENVWVCVWVCLILDQYLSPCETLSSRFPPALRESNEWPCRGRMVSSANGQDCCTT